MPSKKPRRKATALEVLGEMDLSGQHFLITGANQGLGFEAARAIALHNGTVTMACRNLQTAKDAKDKIEMEEPGATVHVLHLDLTDLYSVEQCAQAYKATRRPLHCLILNAAVLNPQPRVTEDKFEATFQVNHLAQFYLTKLLMANILSSAPARVVVVSSTAQYYHIRLKLADVTWERFSPTDPSRLTSPNNAYGISKLANVTFASELNRRYSDHGVTAYSLHPGMIDTNISVRMGGVFTLLKRIAKPFLFKTAASRPDAKLSASDNRRLQEQGAATTVYCATAPQLAATAGGKYFSDCRIETPVRAARSVDVCERVWELSDEMLVHHAQNVKKRTVSLARSSIYDYQLDTPSIQTRLSVIVE